MKNDPLVKEVFELSKRFIKLEQEAGEKLKDLEERVKELEEARTVQIGLNTKFLKWFEKKPKPEEKLETSNWLGSVIEKLLNNK